MTISTIRKATADDLARVTAAAVRFCDRHGIAYDGAADAEPSIDYRIMSADRGDTRIRQLWMACYCRALRVPYDARTTIGYGHVGLRVE